MFANKKNMGSIRGAAGKSKKRISGTNAIVVVFLLIFAVIFFAFTQILDVDDDNDTAPTTASTKEILIQSQDNNAEEVFTLAAKESLGFFEDMPETAWRRLKERFQLTQPNYNTNRKERERHTRYPHYYFAGNFEPEFTCLHEERFGGLGDGGKWICDPHRIVTETKKSCLVYSVGCNGKTQFESAVIKRISPECEIHVFDIVGSGRRINFTEAVEGVGGKFHHWGIGYEGTLKPLKDTIEELGHSGKIIDILKIDCEGCEYKSFKKWIDDWKATGVTVRQFLIELHGTHMTFPEDTEFYSELQKLGYVLFHKEANYINQAGAIEVAFILLSTEFQHND
mmetsp:Transcript_23629/g.36460  ORF Transcript_23629/g.36460 Transcript_23629/m.36460 type:complete len:339 (+) Transcript_23629:97-1113(+)